MFERVATNSRINLASGVVSERSNADGRVTVAGAALERPGTQGRVAAAADVARERRITNRCVAETDGVAQKGERSIGRIQPASNIV